MSRKHSGRALDDATLKPSKRLRRRDFLSAATGAALGASALNVRQDSFAAEIALNTKADGIADDTAAIQAALDAMTGPDGIGGKRGISEIRLPAGNYKISSTLRMPNACRLKGDGRWQSRIFAAPGFKGVMVQDKGNASKIQILDLQIDANNEKGVTTLLDLGNGSVAPWGTEGIINGLFLRGGGTTTLPGCTALNYKVNVGRVEDVSIWFCDNGIVETSNSSTSFYEGIICTAPNTRAFSLNQNAHIATAEIEAPSENCIGVYVNRSCHIDYLTYSQRKGVTNSHAIEIDARAVAFSMDHFVRFSRSGTATLKQILKDNRSGYYHNWVNRESMGGDYQVTGVADHAYIGSQDVFLKGQKLQSFMLRIYNNGGNLQHRISGTANGTIAGDYQSRAIGASAALQNTPTGPDATTALSSGGKIGNPGSHLFIFDTTAQDTTDTDAITFTSVVANGCGQPIYAKGSLLALNVNGVNTRRLVISFADANGRDFALNTTNLPINRAIDVMFLGFIR